MTSEVAGEVPPLGVFLRPELDGDALLGLPGEIAVRLAEATGADPAPVLLATLAFIGNAAGPEPHVVFGGGAEHPARLMVVIIGDAAQGRKGTAVNAVRRLFRQADAQWEGSRITGGIKSPEAMIRLVDDNRADDCRLMLVEPEFARLAGDDGQDGVLPEAPRRLGRRAPGQQRQRPAAGTASHARSRQPGRHDHPRRA